MRRKLIKQGKGALTLSLPKDWIEFNNLKPGNEVELIDESNILKIHSGSVSEQLKTKIDVDVETPQAYRSLIGALYRGGYDIIRVNYSSKRAIANLQKAVDTLYGLEIFDVKEKSCIIKSMYDDESSDIKSHVKKILYIINTMNHVLCSDLKEKNLDSLSEMKQFHDNVLKQRDLVVRMIKEHKLLDNKHFPYYNLVIGLWNVTRSYYYLYRNLKDQKYTEKDVLILEKTGKYLSKSIEFSKGDFNKYFDKNKTYQKIREDVLKGMEKGNSLIYASCLNIVFSVQFCDSSLFLLNHEE